MKYTTKDNTIRFSRYVCFLTVAATVFLAILRIALTPIATSQPILYGVALGTTVILLACLLIFSKTKIEESSAVSGDVVRVFAAFASVAGAAWVVFSIATLFNWWTTQTMPYPNKTLATAFDKGCLYLLAAMGLVAGLLFLRLAVRWWQTKQITAVQVPVLALAPVAWTWVRLVRYITSHVSATGLFRNAYDLGMILFEMVFFLLLARYIAGVGNKASRMIFGVSLCTGLLCAISSISQVTFFLLQNGTAFQTVLLVIAPDFGIGLLAFSFAFSHAYGEKIVCDSQELDAQQPEEIEELGGAEFLISDTAFAMYDPDEAEAAPDHEE